MKSDISGLCQAMLKWCDFIDLAFEYFEIISGHLLTNPYLHYLGMLSLSLRSIICWGKLLEEDEHFCVSSLTVL